MSKKISYHNAPDEVDFSHLVEVDSRELGLPTPQEIASRIRLRPQKVTITLDVLSVNFFKQKAVEHGVKYQSMIREVLREYSQRHAQA